MHAKYEVSTSKGSKVIVKVKVDNTQTDRQTGQKQYAPDHSIRGHKNRQPYIIPRHWKDGSLTCHKPFHETKCLPESKHRYFTKWFELATWRKVKLRQKEHSLFATYINSNKKYHVCEIGIYMGIVASPGLISTPVFVGERNDTLNHGLWRWQTSHTFTSYSEIPFGYLFYCHECLKNKLKRKRRHKLCFWSTDLCYQSGIWSTMLTNDILPLLPTGKYHGENEVAPYDIYLLSRYFCFIPKGLGMYLLPCIKAWKIYADVTIFFTWMTMKSKTRNLKAPLCDSPTEGKLTIIFGAYVRLISLAPTPFLYLYGVKNIPHSYTNHSEKHTSFTYLYTLWVKRYPIDILLKW